MLPADKELDLALSVFSANKQEKGKAAPQAAAKSEEKKPRTDYDAGFERGEYWLHYFRESSPDDDLFGGEPHEEQDLTGQESSEKHHGVLLDNAPETQRLPKVTKNKKTKKDKNKALPQSEDVLAASRQGKKMRKRGVFAAAAVVALLAAGMVVIAEPWVKAGEEYTVPGRESYGGVTQLKIGETHDVLLELGENERIASVYTPDNDVINVSNGRVTGLGEWDSAKVTVTTTEIEVPKPEQKEIKLFGLDISKPYNSVRVYLRNLFGIEKKQPARTELRVLHIYELEFCVKGYTPAKAPISINLFTNDSCQITINHPEGTEIVFEYEGNVIEIEKTLPSEDGSITYIAKSFESVGTGKIIAKIGFFKDGRFVTTAAVEFDVEVLEQPADGEEAVFTNGDYNGSVIIEEKEEDEEPSQN